MLLVLHADGALVSTYYVMWTPVWILLGTSPSVLILFGGVSMERWTDGGSGAVGFVGRVGVATIGMVVVSCKCHMELAQTLRNDDLDADIDL